MRTFINTFLTVCLLLPLSLMAQEPAFFGQQYLNLGQEEGHRCSTMPYLSHQVQQDPTIVERLKAQEAYTQRFAANYDQQSSRQVYTIPVVFHVVYNGNAENISDAKVLSQLQVLNEDFRRTNADADNYWGNSIPADTEIEFCLASVDPNGNPTTGITRTSTRKKSFSYSNDGVKFSGSGGIDAWPRDNYLNIWICDLSNGLLGYAQFPGSGSAATDGVVIDYAYTGTNSTYPYDGGRTATHEVGHWLNLRHIWGDGGCGVDDFVADTPESDASNGGCPIGHVSCGTEDMVQNYMDYTYDACMNLFTQGQKVRMQAVLAPGGARASLANSPACGGGGNGPTCAVPSGQSTSATNSSATLSWNSVSNAIGYNVRYRAAGSSSWNTASVSGTSYNMTGLSTCGSYEWGVEANCGATDGTSGYSTTVSFTTGGCSCGTPTGLSASKKGRDRLTISWNAVAGATGYEVQARPQGGTWVTATTTGTSVTFTGASSGTTYEYQVRTDCNGTFSSYAAGSYNFRAAARIGEDVGVLIYPNPVSDMLTIEFPEVEATQVQIQLIDVLGRVVTEIKNQDTSEFSIEIDVNNFKPGVYFVKISDGKDWNEVSRIVVQ